MSDIVQQLGLDSTFYTQLAIFAVLFVLLGNLYFKPFLKLFQARHKRTVEDREAAEKLMAQAQEKFDEYKRRLSDERASAKQEYETLLSEAKKEEANLLSHARSEAKKITQEAAESAHQQREQIRRQLESDVEALARHISETLLRRRD